MEATPPRFETLQTWFRDHTQSFLSTVSEHDRNIVLKIEHSERVVAEIESICSSLGVKGEDLHLAKTMALFHDIGRFEQYARYETYVDRDSVNHADLSVTVLRREGVLKDFGPDEAELILRAIACHNRAALPEGESPRHLFFERLLRDADKLDILRVTTRYYESPESQRDRILDLDLPNSAGVSRDTCRDIEAGRIVRLEHLHNINDFKLLQASWIFDVNFPRTLAQIRDAGASRVAMEVSSHALIQKPILDSNPMLLKTGMGMVPICARLP